MCHCSRISEQRQLLNAEEILNSNPVDSRARLLAVMPQCNTSSFILVSMARYTNEGFSRKTTDVHFDLHVDKIEKNLTNSNKFKMSRKCIKLKGKLRQNTSQKT